MVRVRNELNQVVIQNENNQLIGRASFPEIGANRVHINKVFVEEPYRNQGYEDLLMKEIVKRLIKDGKTAYITCPYAKTWFVDHEYEYLIWKK